MTEWSDKNDRRRYQRANVEMPFEYRPANAAKNATLRKEKIISLGGGGVFVQTRLTYPKETRLEFSLSLDGEEIKGTSVVRYAIPFNPQGGVQFPGMGIQFDRIDEVDREKIRKWVARERFKQGLAATNLSSES